MITTVRQTLNDAIKEYDISGFVSIFLASLYYVNLIVEIDEMFKPIIKKHFNSICSQGYNLLTKLYELSNQTDLEWDLISTVKLTSEYDNITSKNKNSIRIVFDMAIYTDTIGFFIDNIVLDISDDEIITSLDQINEEEVKRKLYLFADLIESKQD